MTDQSDRDKLVTEETISPTEPYLVIFGNWDRDTAPQEARFNIPVNATEVNVDIIYSIAFEEMLRRGEKSFTVWRGEAIITSGRFLYPRQSLLPINRLDINLQMEQIRQNYGIDKMDFRKALITWLYYHD